MVFLIGIFVANCASAVNQGLPGSVQKLLKKNGIALSSVSVEVRKVDASQSLLALNSTLPRNPASVLKLVTTLAALELLGPTYQWETRYLIDGKVAGDTLQGNLIMVGSGDPFLTVDRFWSHILAIRERGIHHIRGNLIIDDSFFNIPQHDRAAFDGKATRLYNVGPDAALTNFSATRFVIDPYPENTGKGINVFADPPLANLEIHNHLATEKGKCISRNSGWSLRLKAGNSKIEARFSGKYRPSCGTHSISRSIVSNHEYTYRLFRYLWQSMGGTLSGGYGKGVAPGTASELVTVPSRTLVENITSINKFSNNVMARQLLLTIGAELSPGPTPDTRVAAIGNVMQWLDQEGINTTGIVIDNGAGLSRISRISAGQITRLLQLAWDGNWRPEFLASLSLAALDGTMRKRLKRSQLSGRARIKTGLINGTRSMAGYVHSQSGEHYIVTMMIDSSKINYWNGNQIQDALLEWVYKL